MEPQPEPPARRVHVPTTEPIKDWLVKQPTGTKFTTSGLAELLGLRPKSTSWALSKLLRDGFDGLVQRQKASGRYEWKPTFGIVPPAEEPEFRVVSTRPAPPKPGDRLTVLGTTRRGTLLARSIGGGRIFKVEEVDL